jgi:lysophospholipase L1-like esterase
MDAGPAKKLGLLLVNLSLAVFSVFCLLGLGELYFRAYHLSFGAITLDKQLGWKPTANYKYSGPLKNSDGSTYPASITTNDQGFRMYGDPASSRPKIFVVGDSFTQAMYASDDRTYYAVIGQQLNAEIFAYGIAGAGTLQEYLALDRYFDQISPGLVLWQYCANDFVNNSYDLELNSRIDNNGVVRPYLEDNAVVYRLPKPYPGIAAFLAAHSYLFQFTMGKIYTIRAKNSQESVEDKMAAEGLAYPPFAESYQATKQIMSMVKQRAGNTPIVTFECDTLSPNSSAALRQISAELGLPFIDPVDRALVEARQQNQSIFGEDTVHWNEAGHALVGETIAAYLAEQYPWLVNK